MLDRGLLAARTLLGAKPVNVLLAQPAPRPGEFATADREKTGWPHLRAPPSLTRACAGSWPPRQPPAAGPKLHANWSVTTTPPPGVEGNIRPPLQGMTYLVVWPRG